jgi:hypothetical protein
MELAAKGWSKRFEIDVAYKLYKIDNPPICLIMVDPDNPDDAWYVDTSQFEEVIEGEMEVANSDMITELIVKELSTLNVTLDRMNQLLNAIKQIKDAQDERDQVL